jgi:hypothetical protein
MNTHWLTGLASVKRSPEVPKAQVGERLHHGLEKRSSTGPLCAAPLGRNGSTAAVREKEISCLFAPKSRLARSANSQRPCPTQLSKHELGSASMRLDRIMGLKWVFCFFEVENFACEAGRPVHGCYPLDFQPLPHWVKSARHHLRRSRLCRLTVRGEHLNPIGRCRLWAQQLTSSLRGSDASFAPKSEVESSLELPIGTCRHPSGTGSDHAVEEGASGRNL